MPTQAWAWHPPHPRAGRRGFTMVEMLISLVILAMLLTAVATAMHASLQSYSENDKIAATTQTARAVVSRMMSDVRTAAAISTTTTRLTITAPNGGTIEYEFVNGQLLYRRTEGTLVTYVLMDSTDQVRLTSLNIARESGMNDQGQACTKSVKATLMMSAGTQSFAVTASSAVRRNQSW